MLRVIDCLLTDSSMHTPHSRATDRQQRQHQGVKSSGVSKDELELLRETTPQVISESLLSKLSDIEQVSPHLLFSPPPLLFPLNSLPQALYLLCTLGSNSTRFLLEITLKNCIYYY